MGTQYINMQDGLGRVMGNKKLYRRMLNLFLESKEPSGLEEALAAGDYKRASEGAHAIKGMTGNLGFGPLFETSDKLTNELREGPANEETLAAYRGAMEGTLAEATQIIAQLDAEL